MQCFRRRPLNRLPLICIGVIALLLLFLSTAVSVADSGENYPIKVQLKWRNQFQFAGYYAADIKGFYKKAGLEVKIIPGGNNISPTDAVRQGKADIGISTPGILLADDIKPFVVLATIMQSSGYGIISLKEKNILKPSDLAGKKVAVERTQGWSVLKAVLLKEGIDLTQITVVDRKTDSEDILLDPDIDAVITYVSSQPQRIAGYQQQINVIRPEEYGVDFYGDVLFTTKKFAYKNTRQTDAFITASLEGWKYALNHEDELIDYMLTLPDVKSYGATRQQLKIEAQEIRKLIMPDLVEIGHSNLGRWQYMLNLFQRLGVADRNTSLKDFLYDSDEHKFDKWLLPALYILVFICIVVVAIMLLNWQLRVRVKNKTTQLRDEIEQRKRAEQRATNNKEQIEHILKSAHIGLWEFYINSNQTKFNNEFKSILGYPEDYDLKEMDFLTKIHPEDFPAINERINAKDRSKIDGKLIPFRILNAHNKYIHVLSSPKAFLDNENPRISGVFFSIEELKQKELLIIEVSEELTRRNNDLKKFAYITSHNLRAPIVNISALYELIDNTFLSDENKMILKKIEQSIQKLENTLDDLITVVSLDKSDQIFKNDIDIPKTFEYVLSTIESQIIESSASFTFELQVEHILYPKQYFESIIQNLITNAIKYRSHKRPLHIKIESFSDGDSILLKFNDNGIGIDLQRNASKIFGLYQRFHTNISGKGLGLFLVKSHLDSLNDKILVESEVDVGTTFTIIFHNKKHDL